ncbi:MAG: HPr(Ser) kinase/phosphatase [Deltaproteobacteria bacterium]|nr:HPr(Ser) kinase/phosphatase [Deltaproteobacteria bacterium]
MNALESTPRATVTARTLLAAELPFALTLLAGTSGLDRPVRHPRIQKPGLALVGHFDGIVSSRVQILGETELSFLAKMSAGERDAACEAFLSRALSCVVVTSSHAPPEALVRAAESLGAPLLRSSQKSSTTINGLHAYLDQQLAPRTRVHGVFVDVYGVGILLLGKSGIGKSECALELVQRGHRLIADDVVDVSQRPPGLLYGSSTSLLENHLEVRGLGVLNVRDLFGVAAVRKHKRLELVVRLVAQSEGDDWDRLGLDDEWHEILDVSIPLRRIPVRPGKNTTIVVEVAARNELLRRAGVHSAKTFHERLSRELGVGESPSKTSNSE